MRTAATVLSISRSLESLVRRKRSCGVRRGADRKVPARADNSLAAYSTLGSRSFHSSQRRESRLQGPKNPRAKGSRLPWQSGGTGMRDAESLSLLSPGNWRAG